MSAFATTDATIAQKLDETVATLKTLVPANLLNVKIGLVCGSGLSTLADSLRDIVYVPYDKLKGFGKATVAGHGSALAFGLMGPKGVPVVAMLGRFHPYEGYPLSTVVYPIRLMKKLGVEHLILSNATGSLNPSIPVGTIVVIRDHFALPNLTGSLHPLLGPVTGPEYSRFMALSDAYSAKLRRLAFIAAHQLSLGTDALAEGTYAWVSGPTYETPAEGRFLRASGADVVGMSTIPEVVAAREEGLEVMVLSLVTNAVVIPDKYRSIKEEVEAELAGKPVELPAIATVSHEEVLAVGKSKADAMKKLVASIVSLIP